MQYSATHLRHLMHTFSTFILCLFSFLSFGLSIFCALHCLLFAVCRKQYVYVNVFDVPKPFVTHCSSIIWHLYYSGFHFSLFNLLSIRKFFVRRMYLRFAINFVFFLILLLNVSFITFFPFRVMLLHLCLWLFFSSLVFPSSSLILSRSIVLLRFQLNIILCNIFMGSMKEVSKKFQSIFNVFDWCGCALCRQHLFMFFFFN